MPSEHPHSPSKHNGLCYKSLVGSSKSTAYLRIGLLHHPEHAAGLERVHVYQTHVYLLYYSIILKLNNSKYYSVITLMKANHNLNIFIPYVGYIIQYVCVCVCTHKTE